LAFFADTDFVRSFARAGDSILLRIADCLTIGWFFSIIWLTKVFPDESPAWEGIALEQCITVRRLSGAFKGARFLVFRPYTYATAKPIGGIAHNGYPDFYVQMGITP
jgi:hypothetical protein